MRKSYRGPSKDKILLYLTKWYPKFLEIDHPVTSYGVSMFKNLSSTSTKLGNVFATGGNNIGICCFSAKHAALEKEWWGDMSIRGFSNISADQK
jgi:hypothetical protein